MEALSRKTLSQRLRIAGIGLLMLLPIGCVATGQLVPFCGLFDCNICEIVATWNHQVMTCPDPANNGAIAPGLVGRLYLFGPDMKAVIGDGSVQVTLFDEAPMVLGKEPVMLEQWNIDAETLRRLVKKDPIGNGYTLFLPWGTYRPGIRHVHLKLRYQPAKGMPMFADSGPVTLENPANDSKSRISAAASRPAPIQQAVKN